MIGVALVYYGLGLMVFGVVGALWCRHCDRRDRREAREWNREMRRRAS